MPGSRKSENITTKQYCNKFNTLQKNLIKKEIDSLSLYFNFIPQFPYLHTHTTHTHTHTHTHIHTYSIKLGSTKIVHLE